MRASMRAEMSGRGESASARMRRGEGARIRRRSQRPEVAQWELLDERALLAAFQAMRPS